MALCNFKINVMLQEYINNILKEFSSDSESSEHSYRTYLQNMLNSFLHKNIKRELIIKHEPTQVEGKGRPDFKVITPDILSIGLLETKKLGSDLGKALNSEQMERYSQLSDNIILTDYLRFLLIVKGNVVADTSLCSLEDLKSKSIKLEKDKIEELTRILSVFFEAEPEPIFKVEMLAKKLAEKATFLREYCYIELEKERDETNLMQGVYEVFKESLLPLLETQYFSDIYAQTLAYSLFLAALNCDEPHKQLNRSSAFSLLPHSFPLIKELFHRLDDFPREITWAIDEIIDVLKVTDFTAIKKEFSDYRNKDQGFNDPFIYFYEDFLTSYDKSQRELRGVYYTPEPVVSFIVRSIEEILKDTFKLNDGLISKKVTLLDFATGTGTFLLNAFKLALEQAQTLGDRQTVNKILNEQIINNFYGFELLVAPYIVAQLKITEFFKELGYSLDEGKRLNIFLTNTLTNKEPQPFPIMPALSKEGREANRIKNQDILVILGNPPYSVSSQNKAGFITDEKMATYKEAVKSEKSIGALSDDYIKFIRFAHWKMESVENGVIGIISNNSYLDGLIHRSMRKELFKIFDKIYILNLHGNARKREGDQNVFNIRVGVAIAIFVKSKDSKNKEVKYFSFLKNNISLREQKLDFLEKNTCKTVEWEKLELEEPYFWFIDKNINGEKLKYLDFCSLYDIFKIKGVGIGTCIDKISIDSNLNALKARVNEILTKKYRLEEIIKKYGINPNTTWEYKRAITSEYSDDKFVEIDYRLFDRRFVFYDNKFLSRSHKALMDNFFHKENIAIVAPRQMKMKKWRHAFVTDCLSDESYLAGGRDLGAGVVFPLYLFIDKNKNDISNGNDFLFNEEGKRDNFTKEFRHFIKNKYKKAYSPEQVMAYIYAVLHSPNYREKYNEFLRIDFPRIPFVDDENLFLEISAIGSELIAAHLLKRFPITMNCRSEGESDNFKVELVKYENGKVYFNKERYFSNIPREIWEYRVGGYQVLEKWLSERKKLAHSLRIEDLQHFISIVNVINFTFQKMEELDKIAGESL